ncbi:MaoC family dehydratase [Achromobacter sp. UMC71]|uniref:MaoC family dehydratase n=1 Tax=Achromobacter sp. UMC71 TaxID=1862320 RepID=UPI0015FFB4B7|nr:MaoC family dehydratase [Achromobacter sp. UMC71]MBB1628659.1 dehydratase [Achromobacter sp. UMC71]
MTTSPAPRKLYLEDLAVGDTFTSATHRLDLEQVRRFASEFDPQPFHLDETAARNSLFQGLAASGWHTAAITMRLLVDSMPLADGVIGAGAEVSWSRPARPGDTLQVKSTVLAITPSRSKPDRGIVLVESVTFNQDGEPVQTLTSKVVSFRRK